MQVPLALAFRIASISFPRNSIAQVAKFCNYSIYDVADAIKAQLNGLGDTKSDSLPGFGTVANASSFKTQPRLLELMPKLRHVTLLRAL